MDISIVVTAFNYARYLNQCLDSCLNQNTSGLDYEVIVVNDGSTDNTKELLDKRSDKRLRIIHLNNSGIEIASNCAFREARGKFIVRLDADDVLLSDYLNTMSHWLKSSSGFIYSDYEIINDYDEVQESVKLPEFSREEILTRGDFLATGTIYPSALLFSAGAYNIATKNSGLENYELIIKLIQSGVQGIHVPRSLFKYRRHANNISSTRVESIVSYGQKLFDDYHLGQYTTNQYHPYKLVLK